MYNYLRLSQFKARSVKAERNLHFFAKEESVQGHSPYPRIYITTRTIMLTSSFLASRALRATRTPTSFYRSAPAPECTGGTGRNNKARPETNSWPGSSTPTRPGRAERGSGKTRRHRRNRGSRMTRLTGQTGNKSMVSKPVGRVLLI